MEQKDEVRSIQLQELRKRMDKGLTQAEHGEGADGEAFMRDVIEDLDTREETQSWMNAYNLTPVAQEDMAD
jgi:hypothetical protein